MNSEMIKEKKQADFKKYKQALARYILKLIGWKAVGELPGTPKYVMIGYPHTSNWDVPLGLLIFTALGIRLHWVGKHTLFKRPFGWFVKKMGGIPLNRSTTKNFVQQVIDIFNNSKELILTVSPEGTRGKTSYWKTGFYYIAVGAKVPIATGFLDYSKKTGGFGPLVRPTGDIETDFKTFNTIYSGMLGKHPEDMAEIRIKQ